MLSGTVRLVLLLADTAGPWLVNVSLFLDH